MQLSGLLVHDLGVKDDEAVPALVLEVSKVLLNDVALSRHDWLGEGDLLLTVQKHHGVESRDAWDAEVAISERSTMADSHSVGWECLEAISQLIGELEVLLVHRVILETDSE